MTDAAAELPDRPRGALGLILDPAFGGMFWGKFLSSSAVWVHGVVAAILVYAATGSAFAVALVSIAQFAPQLLLTPWSGTWADRGHAHAQMIVGRLICAVGSGSLAIWTLLVDEAHGWSAAWPILGASLVLGLGFVLGGPAQQSVVPRLVRPDELPTAMTLNTAPIPVSRVAGPAIGAFVASTFGAADAFMVAAAGHAIFALILIAIRIPDGDPHVAGTDYSVRAAMRFVAGHRGLLLVLTGTALASVGSEPTITLAPALSEQLNGGTALVGALTAAFGGGAGVGLVATGLVARRAEQPTVAGVGLALMAIGMALAAATPWAPTTMAGFALSGMGFTSAVASLGTLAQQGAPPVLRGRIMAFWMVGFLGSRPLAASLAGGLADLFTVRIAVACLAALLLMAAVLCRPSRLAL